MICRDNVRILRNGDNRVPEKFQRSGFFGKEETQGSGRMSRRRGGTELSGLCGDEVGKGQNLSAMLGGFTADTAGREEETVVWIMLDKQYSVGIAA